MCGIIGIFGHEDAAQLAYLGLFAQQHRGQESAGIAAADGVDIRCHTGMGLIDDVLGDDEASRIETLKNLPGGIAIGHTRYSTCGGCRSVNAQPFVSETSHGPFAIAHNGNLVNARAIREELRVRGSILVTTSDTEVIPHLYTRSKQAEPIDAIVEALERVDGAYSLVMLTPTQLIAARDPYGFRPMCIGKLGETIVVASETNALDLLGAKYHCDVEPGEVICFDGVQIRRRRLRPQTLHHCVFEHIYFARPDSYVFGDSVNDVRTRLGELLAEQQPADADIVVPIPDSGNCAARGYSRRSGMPLEFGLIRNHYTGRTFIQPHQKLRALGVKKKLNPVGSIVAGKRVVLVDDSLVRGTTSRKIVKLVRAAGATEVHMRISCPPTVASCHYGIDTPRQEELIAATHTIEEIRREIGADSLGYLNLDGLAQAVGSKNRNYCTACFTGHYPVGFETEIAEERRR